MKTFKLFWTLPLGFILLFFMAFSMADSTCTEHKFANLNSCPIKITVHSSGPCLTTPVHIVPGDSTIVVNESCCIDSVTVSHGDFPSLCAAGVFSVTCAVNETCSLPFPFSRVRVTECKVGVQ